MDGAEGKGADKVVILQGFAGSLILLDTHIEHKSGLEGSCKGW